jgi:hypothetical protein
LALLVPPAVVTSTLAVPAEPAGVVAVIEVELTTTTLVAAVAPMVTPVAPVKLLPVIVTLVPPEVDPLLGETEETTGAGVADGVQVTDHVTVAPDVAVCAPLESTGADSTVSLVPLVLNV